MNAAFGFLRDPLFLVCGASYVANRWMLKPVFSSPFLRCWFSDLLLAPCALPVVFWIFRILKLRVGDHPPSFVEISWILAAWSVLFEWAGPRLWPHATADWGDVAMYWTGGVLAWVIWNLRPFATASA